MSLEVGAFCLLSASFVEQQLARLIDTAQVYGNHEDIAEAS